MVKITSVKLSEVSKVVPGATPKTQVDKYWGGNILWATPKDLTKLPTKYISNTTNKITELGYQSCSTKILPVNSVLLSSRAPIGHIAINTLPMCTNQGFKSVIPNAERLNSSFLYYWFKANVEKLQNKGRGATFKEISKSIVENLEIPLPPLEYQRFAADILDRADALRTARRKSIEKLDQLLQSVFLDMFGDPVTNPKGWDFSKLQKHFAQDREGTKCGPFGSALKKEEYVDSGIPVWVMDNIRGMEFCEENPLYITKNKFEKLKAYGVKKGDIIISRAGTVGKMCVVEYEATDSLISTNLIRLSLDDKVIDPYFFVALMNFCKGRIGRLKTGDDGSYSFMNTGILKKLEIPIPPISFQKEYTNFRVELKSKSWELSKSFGSLDNLFCSLQQRAFRGELTSSSLAELDSAERKDM